MTRTPDQAVAFSRTIIRYAPGYCLRFVRTCFDVGPLYDDAIEAWHEAEYRHTDRTPPRGVPVFFAPGGSNPHGHVALSVGGGRCRSTDYPRSGVVSEVLISTLAAQWDHPYLGWTEDLNGVRIYTEPTGPGFPLPKGHVFGYRQSLTVHNGTEGPITAANVRKIQRRVRAKETGVFDYQTALRVKAWKVWKRLGTSSDVGSVTWAAMFTPAA